jgi:coenzyme F420-reducing hydrogenase delta subunit
MTDFEPKILGFLCNWCSYAGADLSGVSRIQYPPNLRVIRVMCSGRVDPVLIFNAFKDGADGVAVLGCHPGDCHYQSGNYQAMRKMDLTTLILARVGIDPERLKLDWVSAAEGQRFGALVTEFTELIREKGPIAEKTPELERKATLGAAIAEAIRIRWLVGKEEQLLAEGNVYGEKVDPEQYSALLSMNVAKEYDRQLIMSLIQGAPQSVTEIASMTEMTPSQIFKYITEMENKGEVHLHGFEGNTPRYVLASAGGGEER